MNIVFMKYQSILELLKHLCYVIISKNNFVNFKYHYKLLQINQLNFTIIIYTIKVIIVSLLFSF